MNRYTLPTKSRLNEQDGKGIVFTFGRFNPPHTGHELLINKVMQVSKRKGYDHGIYVSTSQGDERNPIPYDEKVRLLRAAFKKSNVAKDKTLKNPFYVAKELSDKGYKNVILVVGGDRVKELERSMKKYVNHSDPNKSWNFDSFEVVSAGRRDADADDVSGMSASKMRKSATSGDFDTFKRGAPSGMKSRDVKKMYTSIRKTSGIKEEIQSLFDALNLLETSRDDIMSLGEDTLSVEAFNFLLEQDEEDDSPQDTPTLVVLSKFEESDEYSDTVSKIDKACDSLDISFFAVSVDDAFIVDEEVSDDELIIHNYDGENNKITLNTDNTVCWPRGGVMSHQSGMGLLSTLQDSGVFCVNKLSTMELCRNKFATSTMLDRNNIPSPRTALVTNEDAVDIALENIGGEFPVVIKTITGAEGIGVSIVESYKSLKSVLQSLWKFDAEVIIQEYMEIEYDVRTIVLDGKIIACMKRLKGDGDFRTNKALGNETEPYDLSEEEKSLVLKTAKLVGGFLSGVDHVTVDGEHMVLEVNTSPGSGAQKYTMYDEEGEPYIGVGQDIVNVVVGHITDKNNWVYSTKEIGELEKIYIYGVGELISKADTGNGSYNSLHAEEITIEDDVVSFFTENDTEMVLPLIDMVTINMGGDTEERPVVPLDFKMGDKEYKSIPFSLTDRDDMDYPVLLGKEFLQKARFSVNVSKKYELTEEPFCDWFAWQKRNLSP